MLTLDFGMSIINESNQNCLVCRGGLLMEVTKKAEYAISTLLELAINHGQFVSSKEIALRRNIPGNFLPQIIAILGTANWVEGVRGPGGGVRLICDPNKITILDILELIEGPLALTRCLAGEGNCVNEGLCQLHPIWTKAQSAVIQVLTGTTLADIIEKTTDQ